MRDDEKSRIHDVNDGRIERAKDSALGEHSDNPDKGDLVGEAAGGISGVLTGAAIGSVGGPIGTIIGGIAGAAGGWWTGRAISEAAHSLTSDDESYYRRHYESSASRAADRTYEHARPAYHIGHIASRNPEYRGRAWEDIEPDLRRGWSDDVSKRHGTWDSMQAYAREGYVRGAASPNRPAAESREIGNARGDVDGVPSARPGAPADSGRSIAKGTDERF